MSNAQYPMSKWGEGALKNGGEARPGRGEADSIGRDSPPRYAEARPRPAGRTGSPRYPFEVHTLSPPRLGPGRGLAPLLAAGRASGRLESGKQVFRHPASPGGSLQIGFAPSGQKQGFHFFQMHQSPGDPWACCRHATRVVGFQAFGPVIGTPHIGALPRIAEEDVYKSHKNGGESASINRIETKSDREGFPASVYRGEASPLACERRGTLGALLRYTRFPRQGHYL